MLGGRQFVRQEMCFFPLDPIKEKFTFFKRKTQVFLILFKVYFYLPSELTLTSICEVNRTGIVNFQG